MEELPLMQDGVRRGTLCCRMDAVRAHFSVRCPNLGPGLYKVWLTGPEGRLLLGTLEPVGECLLLERAFSLGALRTAGVYPPRQGELTVSWAGQSCPPPEGWGDRQAMPLRPEDGELRRALGRSGPGWYRRLERGWLLAWPWEAGEELPAPSLACMGWTAEVGGTGCFLLRLNERGWPAAGNAGRRG